MMRYQAKQSSFRYFVVSLSITFLVFLLDVSGVIQPFRSFGTRLVLPVMEVGATAVRWSGLPMRVMLSSWQSYQRVQDLELRYAEALAQLGEVDSMRTEIATLRQMASDSSLLRRQHFLLPIIGYGQPLLARQNQEHITEGQMVLINEVLVGQVGRVSDLQVEVRLLSQPTGTHILAKTEHGVTGVVEGDGKNIWVNELPIEANITTGERVVTVGQVGVRPGIFIGQVKSIEQRTGTPTQRVMLDQHVSFFESSMAEVE